MLIADLHIHSKYSRATSGECVPEFLEFWARRKGIDLVGTGDFTHPAWRQELREKLVPDGEGLYTLREEARLPDVPAAGSRRPRFVVTGEISSIYKKDGRVRKVHNLILLPGLEEAEALSRRLEAVGNLHSDGRPILGLDSRDLLEITLECCPRAVFIPAHIWTPHFSMFGAFSGFDTVEECFGDLSAHIRAIETGLSSDPPMNWRLSALDRMALVSNSDAHSPSKLGREANLLDIPFSYSALARALDGRGARGLRGTIEFFPEEGKYHFDGHRACKQCLTPQEADEAGGRCPVCGRKLTTGVLHRVEQLADRPEGFAPEGAAPFESLVPLPEVIAASTGFSAASGKVAQRYEFLLRELGPEFYILREAPLEEIERLAGPCVSEGVRRMRAGQVERSPGYDGEYGKIKLLEEREIEAFSGQLCLFTQEQAHRRAEKAPARRRPAPAAGPERAAAPASGREDALAGLNGRQLEAATASDAVVAVVAGPGTGKTRTLVSRAAWLLEQGAKPAEITAVTFTNRAAAEMRGRLERRFGNKKAVRAMTIGTFHAICLSMLREREGGVTLLDDYGALAVAGEVIRELGLGLSPKKLVQGVSALKSGGEDPELPEGAFDAYCARLRAYGVLDYDDLLLETLALFASGAVKKQRLRGFTHLLVDEFQDLDPIQYRLVRAWSAGGGDLFVIGDPDQSIYGFRGSDARCFDRLAADCPGARRVGLVENYRSTPQILGCALPVIDRNGGEPRRLEPKREDGAAVRLVTSADPFAEAIFVAKEIGRMVGGVDMLAAGERRGEGGRGFSDVAVLYRTHRQAEVLEKCLAVEGIPYVVAGRDKLLADEAVRGTLGFFRALVDPADALSRRACLDTVLKGPDGPARWEALGEKFGPLVLAQEPRKLLEEFWEDCGLERALPLERLGNMAVFERDMPSFLRTVALGRESDLRRSGSRAVRADAVTLTTLHGSKGLEFPVVFLCGLLRGTVPLESPGRPCDPEEERRLFYVGMTRARDELVLLTGDERSPFLAEIPPQALTEGAGYVSKRRAQARQLSLFD